MNRKLPILAILLAFTFSGCGGQPSSLTPSSTQEISGSNEVKTSVITGSIADIISKVGTREEGETTTSYQISGFVAEIVSLDYNVFYLDDLTGKILIYGLNTSTIGDYVLTKGDTVKVQGVPYYNPNSISTVDNKIEIKYASLLDHPSRQSSSSIPASSIISSSEIKSLEPSSSIIPSSSSIGSESSSFDSFSSSASSEKVLEGILNPSDLGLSAGYQSTITSANIGEHNVSIELEETAYNTTYASVGTLQFAKVTHDTYTSVVTLKNVKVKTITLVVHGFKISDGEDGIHLLLGDALFTKTNSEIIVTKSTSVYKVTFSLSTALTGDLIISNNSENARYVSTIDFSM